MLDLKYLEENEQKVKKDLSNRKNDPSAIDQIIALNGERKKSIAKLESHRKKVNEASKSIGQLMKQKKFEAAERAKSEVHEIKELIQSVEEKLAQDLSSLNAILAGIPNLLDPEVPVGDSEEDNQQTYSWGEPPRFSFPVKDHIQLGEDLGMLDFEAAANVTGSRFSVIKSDLARLERALIQYFLNFHAAQNYIEVSPPYLVHEHSMFGTGQLPKFAEDAFKIEGRPWYLIPTSEVPLTNLLREKISPHDLFPQKYCALSPCFRSEAGSYGKDVKGLVRLHQFLKVEMVQVTLPEQSEQAHQDMRMSGRKILEELKLPYREVILCSADIGFSAQKTYDLEVWLPAQDTYREISSISNCGDFQARRASLRYRNEQGKVHFLHSLNGSGLAVGRTLLAIMENYQREDGSIEVPEVLRVYMGGQDVITKG